jgi:LmbE family N-acetylglucosaminyl deacetylase
LKFWRLPDREVAPDASLVAKIRSALRIQAPDWLLAPSPFEVHPDHVAVCRAAMEAAAGNSVKLGFFEVGQPLLPNLFVDITSVADDKRRAMDCFVSQLANQRYDCQISALNQYRAYTLGPAVTHAEALWFAPPAQCHDAAGVLDAVRAEVARRLGFGMGSS